MKKIFEFIILNLWLLIGVNVFGQNESQEFWNDDLRQIAKSESNKDWIYLKDHIDFEAESFFIDNATAFNLTVDDSFVLEKVTEDNLGYKHFRYQQFYKGIKVENCEFIIHENTNGKVYLANGKMVRELSLPVKPVITQKQAIQIAIGAVPAEKYYWDLPFWENFIKEKKDDPNATYFPDPELVVTRSHNSVEFSSQNFSLAYKVDIYSFQPPIEKRLYIDAMSGELINEISLSTSCNSSSVSTSYYGTVSFYSSLSGPEYRLLDDCDVEIRVRDWNSTNTGGSIPPTALDITSSNNSWNNNTTQEFGASTLWPLDWAVYYFQSVHNRSSYDGAGTAIDAFVNAKFSDGQGNTNTSNASWSGIIKVGIGSPDFSSSGFPCISSDPLEDAYNSVDVIAHELGHAVDGSSANLVYQGESGALDESFADIYGEMTERLAIVSGNDWKLLDEKCTGYIRNMADPKDKNDPDTYMGTHWVNTSSPNDNGGVHTNSGVQNYWFYLLSAGGSGTNDNGDYYNMSGIGSNKAEKIAYRNHTNYLTSSSTYADARLGSLQAAADLYGNCSFEQMMTGHAWFAVGIGDYYGTVSYILPSLGNVIPGGVHTSYLDITSPPPGGTASVLPAFPVQFKAGGHIKLNPGFNATANGISSIFTARAMLCEDLDNKTGVSNMQLTNKPFMVSLELANDMNGTENSFSVYPNPFKTETTVEIQIIKDKEVVSVEIFDIKGKLVKTLLGNILMSSGRYKLNLNSENLDGGLFFCHVRIGDNDYVTKLVKLN